MVAIDNQASHDLLLCLPLDIKRMILELLGGGLVNLYQPGKYQHCCTEGHKIPLHTPWSPWHLTQLSKAHCGHWSSLYHDLTIHRICLPQLGDYINTYFQRQYKVPPAHDIEVVIYADALFNTPINALLKAEELFPGFGLTLEPYQWGSDSWANESLERGHWCFIFEQLVNCFSQGLMEELLPGAGKIESLFFLKDRSLVLLPAPDYLHLSPALDPELRSSLSRLWNQVDVDTIELLVLPRAYKNYNKDLSSWEGSEVDHPFWRNPHGETSVVGVGCCPGSSLHVKPAPHVLPSGHSLMSIINEQEIRTMTGVAIFVSLLTPEDDEFNILVGSKERDESYEANDDGNGPEEEDGDDEEEQEEEEEEEEAEILEALLDDMKVSLSEVLENVYGQPGHSDVHGVAGTQKRRREVEIPNRLDKR